MQNRIARDILLVSADDKLICPLCGRPTQQRVLPTSRLIDFPLYCKHCRKATVVNVNTSQSQSQRASASAK
nr:MAG TPA: cysteine-rich protein [Caudoviricetes sp.]DAX05891.1 MAG TPA: cysteine-rich protein [Bacteriophage sp.]